MPLTGTTKSELRKQLRALRRKLSNQQQQLAAQSCLQLAKRQGVFQRARSLALYCANDGEVNVNPIWEWAIQRQKICCWPVLNRKTTTLRFVPAQPSTSFRPNRFGIPEPVVKRSLAIPAWRLDVILLPLVAFDRRGGRLGMGGGFYDRTLQQLQRRPRRPLLIGVGHACQEVQTLPMDDWDVPLDAVLSNTGWCWIAPPLRSKIL